MSGPAPGRVLRASLLAWGLGHLLLGRTAVGWTLLLAELGAAALVVWLTIGLADSSLYLIPFLAGAAFIAGWAWQAAAAYRSAVDHLSEPMPGTGRSAAAAMGWLCLPLLVWGAGFWLVAAHSANPSAVLDRFVSDWSRDTLSSWPAAVTSGTDAAAASLGSGSDRLRDVRLRVVSQSGQQATAIAEAIHFERRETRLLGLFPGSELVPVADRQVLTLELASQPVELPGGGDLGAVRWELVSTSAAPSVP